MPNQKLPMPNQLEASYAFSYSGLPLCASATDCEKVMPREASILGWPDSVPQLEAELPPIEPHTCEWEKNVA
jgi:hypothetical protein